MNLVIVESPKKTKVISKILGKDYRVIATVGHFRDLNPKDISVDVVTYDPIYVVTKPDVASKLKQAVRKSKMVFLATDMDREGEAISQHVLEYCKPLAYKRLLFNEITKATIMKSFKNQTIVNANVVNSQKARRVIDRLYGYLISPVLQKHFKEPTLSAGRVQSVATKMIVDKANKVKLELEQDVKSEYQALANVDSLSWQLYKRNKIKKLLSYDDALIFVKRCALSTLSVKSIVDTESTENPLPPYDTASLQQDAHTKLRLTSKETMSQLQKLYEAGAITYIRTKSNHLSDDAYRMISKWLGKDFHRRVWPSDGGHEAIRPTDINKTDGTALYVMIWKRTVASQMLPAKVSTRTIQLDISKYKPYEIRRYFQTSIKTVLEPGWQSLYGVKASKPDYEPKDLTLTKLTVTQCLPTVSNRFTECTFISKIKKLGIGSPSTYASIINTIQDRGYVTVSDVTGVSRTVKTIELTNKHIKISNKVVTIGSEKRRLVPTPLGIKVTDYLLANHSELLDYDLTAKMEKKLDKIAEGKENWRTVVREYHTMIRTHVPEKSNYNIIEGKYGPYLRVRTAKGFVNVSLPKGIKANDVTDAMVKELVARKRQ